ncbi:hypothetical protein MUO71_06225 [Candidatus Bathyarchaeota archaeon]|nr:hypothetical protein [Candidatus Bathyarchaeota archaeon]
MANTVCKTVYFEKPGSKNTEETLKLAKERAETLDIKNIVVASTTGETGVKASEAFKGYNLVVVTHVTGFTKPNMQQLSPKNRKTIESNGAKILTTTHAFGTLGRAINKKFGAIQVDGIISAVLRLFGQGMKVACEIACMAADAGLIQTDEEAIMIGGTGGGADTAVVLKPSNTHAFFDLMIKEIICKPRL